MKKNTFYGIILVSAFIMATTSILNMILDVAIWALK